ncbi:hypothetical protein F0562_007834 [Nyssa sinensis]|uniref:EF-hand domain-containing protein n=1 Tax=Nyssa sinensis TaxID=561372 RepID=A0A5J5A8C0_9ASTE|nr:hypothetical protein F0562_007834 [Nyssa sinensis]
MAERLGGGGLIDELCKGYRLLMDGEKEVSTFESLKRNSALLALQDLRDDELQSMVREGDLDGDGTLNQMEFCVLMFRLTTSCVVENLRKRKEKKSSSTKNPRAGRRESDCLVHYFTRRTTNFQSYELKMEAHTIEICGDVPVVEKSFGGSKGCGGAACGFSDATTSSRDATERAASMRKLLIAVVLCIIFMSVEVVGGIKANSLAILTDAAHLLSDVAAFAISLFSLWAAGWEATPRQSYGFFRIEILGALVSIQMIWVLTGILVYEAITRIIHDTGEVQGFLIDHGHGERDHGHEDDTCHPELSFTTHHHHVEEHSKQGDEHHHAHEADQTEPLLKTCSEGKNNLIGGVKKKKQQNINVRGAYLHVLGDSIQSIGVMIGGAIIWYKPEWKIIDLICTLIFSLIVLGTTINMLWNILEVLMESTPREIDATRLEKGLCEMDEVVAIHELHIWAITVGKVLLACHVKIKPEANADVVLDKVIDYIRREYNISHVTIQIERE